MNLYYDFHLHSCLSPCGDADMTPANIVGMAVVNGLDVIALTDHNSCKNCPAFLHFAEQYGILAIPGMELTTMEEVHIVCLFSKLSDALEFDSYVYQRLIKIKNKPEIFGRQQIFGIEDSCIGEEENLLINATDITFDEVYDLVTKFHGIMIPAHIDKNAYSLLSNLGLIPTDSKFSCVEVKDLKNLHRLRAEHPYLEKCRIISDSDAHYLENIQLASYTLWVEEKSVEAVLDSLI